MQAATRTRRSNFDAEAVISGTSPYRRTAEPASAAKMPHKKRRNPPTFRWVSTSKHIHFKLNMTLFIIGVAFVLRKSASRKTRHSNFDAESVRVSS